MMPRDDAYSHDWQQLEHWVAPYRLTPGPRDQDVETRRFPSMIRTYRHLVRFGWMPPTQDEYADRVERLVRASRDGSGARPDGAAVRARAGRAYISLVVQHHAHLVLLAHYGVSIWDDDLDMHYGVDLVTIGDGAVAVGLALMAPTRRSLEAAERKQHHRYDDLPFTIRSLAVEPHGYTAGPFWLYDPEVLISTVDAVLREHSAARAFTVEQAAVAAYENGERRPKASRQDFMDGARAAARWLRRERLL